MTEDTFIWVFLSALWLGVIGFIAYHIRNLIKRRREIKEERDIREARKLEKNRKQQQRNERHNRVLGIIIRVIGLMFIFGAAAIFLYQIYHWLKLGHWLEIPFSNILAKVAIPIGDDPELRWKGFAKILVWIAHRSSALVMAILGSALLIVGNITEELK